MDGVSLCSLLWEDRMLRRLAMMGLNGVLLEGPCNFLGVVDTWCWCPSVRGGADGSEDCLVEDKRQPLHIQVDDGAACIGESDQMPDNVSGPLHLPGKVNAVSIFFDPYPWRPIPSHHCILCQMRPGGQAQQDRSGGLLSWHIGSAIIWYPIYYSPSVPMFQWHPYIILKRNYSSK